MTEEVKKTLGQGVLKQEEGVSYLQNVTEWKVTEIGLLVITFSHNGVQEKHLIVAPREWISFEVNTNGA